MSCPFIWHPSKRAWQWVQDGRPPFLAGCPVFSIAVYYRSAGELNPVWAPSVVFSDLRSCSSARSSRFGAQVQYLWLNIINSCYFILLRIMYTLWLLMCQAFLQHHEHNLIISHFFNGQHKAIHFSERWNKKKKKKKLGTFCEKCPINCFCIFVFQSFSNEI